MIYISRSTIPSRIKNLNKSVQALLKQTLKPDKIIIVIKRIEILFNFMPNNKNDKTIKKR